MWAMPRWTDCRVFWWNKDIFSAKGPDPETPPTSWEQLEAFADAIFEREATGLIKYLGFSPIAGNPPGFLQFWVYLWQLGGEYLSEDYSKPVFNGPEGVAALEWMIHMTDKYGGVDEISEFLQSVGTDPNQDVFGLGFLGQMIHGQWQVANYSRYAPDLNYGLATFPLPPGGQAVNYIGGWTYVIPKGVPTPDASWKYIEYSMQDEHYKKIIDFNGTVPAYEDLAFSDWWLDQDPRRELFANEVKVGRWVPVTPGVAEIFNIQIRLLDEALHHLKTPQEALDEAAAAVQKVLDDNRELREGTATG
jgi:ABC-type glycerol-3-phosphate transport system substrate-binding protein